VYEQGHLREGMLAFCVAIRRAVSEGDAQTRIDAWRRLAVAHHRLHEPALALEACQTSLQLAWTHADDMRIAESLNTLAAFAIEAGQLDSATQYLREAQGRAGHRHDLLVRIQQNMGIIATIQGDHRGAMRHYREALRTARRAGDVHGTARAYHNLAMLSADRARWSVADKYFRESAILAARVGDTHLQGLCSLNRCEVLIARGRYREAQAGAHEARAIFERSGATDGLAAAHRFLGIVAREEGWLASAEQHLARAITLAQSGGLPLEEGEALRELARACEQGGRNQDALRHLHRSHQRFQQLRAGPDEADAAARMHRLEATYLEVARTWGASIESADRYTFGHCARVARYAESLGRMLGLDPLVLTTLRIGAYLHDVGKVRVPEHILNKPGRLDAAELREMQRHPEYGISMLEDIDFPWDIRPIIRWHHEHADGSGYPDALAGDDIPLTAQVTGIVDVFDALTTSRSYRPAMSTVAALQEIARVRAWWRRDVYDAFVELQHTDSASITARAAWREDVSRSQRTELAP
jgi:putative nucleotidyltransferase with HDIG domain